MAQYDDLMFRWQFYVHTSTGKSLSEALISASTNPQYDDRLVIEFQVQYMKIPSSNLGRTSTQHVLPMYCKKLMTKIYQCKKWDCKKKINDLG